MRGGRRGRRQVITALMPWATHILQWVLTAGLQGGNAKLIPEKHPQFGLRAETCPHEAEIASNRGSAGRGEYVLGSCTHRPSSQQSRGCLKYPFWGPKAKSAMGTKS